MISGTLSLNLGENYSEFSDDINRQAANYDNYDAHRVFNSIGDYRTSGANIKQ